MEGKSQSKTLKKKKGNMGPEGVGKVGNPIRVDGVPQHSCKINLTGGASAVNERQR